MITAKLVGIEKFEADLARREAELIENASKFVFIVAQDAAARMREAMLAAPSPSAPGSAPGIVTGNLINSIQAEQEKGHLSALVRVGTKGKKRGGAPHWHLLEFGTRKMAARPFIRPNGKAAAVEGERLLGSLLKDHLNGRG